MGAFGQYSNFNGHRSAMIGAGARWIVREIHPQAAFDATKLPFERGDQSFIGVSALIAATGHG
jgi:hypothetical protein